jgi:hypothetical protein
LWESACTVTHGRIDPTPGIPVGCCCVGTNGHIDAVGSKIHSCGGAGSIDRSCSCMLVVDSYCGCHGWPSQWHCPYLVGFLCSHHTDGFASTVGSSCCLSMVTMTLSTLVIGDRWSCQHCRLLLLLPIQKSTPVVPVLTGLVSVLSIVVVDGHSGTFCFLLFVRTDGHIDTVGRSFPVVDGHLDTVDSCSSNSCVVAMIALPLL